MSSEAISLLVPEMIVAVAAVAVYLAGAFVESARPWRWLAGGTLVLAAVAIALQSSHGPAGPLAGDRLGQFIRVWTLAVGLLLVLMACHAPRRQTSEYFGSLLLALAGAMLAAQARDLVLLFVSLELVSIPTCVLLFLGRPGADSKEATAKYFFLSVLSSAILLYGLSFLYGAAGSTDLAIIAARLVEASPAALDLAKVAMFLLAAGLAFKIAAVPMHFYAPDVYQGTTYLNAAFLSVVPKMAALAVLARLLAAMAPIDGYAWRVLAVLAAGSILLGNTVALWQQNLRRLLAYSSIAQGGYMLLAVAAARAAGGVAGRWDGTGGMLFYLVVYALATLGTLAALAHLEHDGRRIDHVEELAGLGRACPGLAAALTVCLLSLTGIPPLAGFWGKLVVLAAALDVPPTPQTAAAGAQGWFIALAVVGVLGAAVGAAFYLRIVAVLYFRLPLAAPRSDVLHGTWIAAVLSAVLCVVLGLHSGPLLEEAYRSAGVPPAMNPERT